MHHDNTVPGCETAMDMINDGEKLVVWSNGGSCRSRCSFRVLWQAAADTVATPPPALADTRVDTTALCTDLALYDHDTDAPL
jgi:hypothetical protein